MSSLPWWSMPCHSHSQRVARAKEKAAYCAAHPLDGDSGIFSFTARDGKECAIAKSGREYLLWGAETSARLRRVQLRAFEEVEEELIRRDGGRSEQPASVSVLENENVSTIV